MKRPAFFKRIKQVKSDKRFREAMPRDFNMIFYAFLVGLVAGIFASVFRLVLAQIEAFRNHLYSEADPGNAATWAVPVIFGVAGVGIALFLVRKFAPETAGSGVQEIEGALDEVRPLRWRKVLPVKFIASLFSLGSGLLLGREGPTIQIGANTGKMIKELFRQPDKENNPLISAGSAAGLASAFNAPLSGVVFVMEEMHEHFRHTFLSVSAIMVASATADLVVRSMVDTHPVIMMMVYQPPDLSKVWLFLVLGIFFSFIGLLFNRLLIVSLDFFSGLSKMLTVVSIVLAGAGIAVVGIFHPETIGGGYETIKEVLEQSFTIQFLAVLFAGRMLLTLLSYGLGVPGGIFAPLVALGVIFGMLFGLVMQYFFPDIVTHPGIFAVAGIAGIFASTVRAPMTGLVLTFEITWNFELILPLIITSVAASVVTARMGNLPIYSILLERTLERESR